MAGLIDVGAAAGEAVGLDCRRSSNPATVVVDAAAAATRAQIHPSGWSLLGNTFENQSLEPVEQPVEKSIAAAGFVQIVVVVAAAAN